MPESIRQNSPVSLRDYLLDANRFSVVKWGSWQPLRRLSLTFSVVVYPIGFLASPLDFWRIG